MPVNQLIVLVQLLCQAFPFRKQFFQRDGYRLIILRDFSNIRKSADGLERWAS